VECRIQVVQHRERCTVYLAGRLNAAQVHELRGVCAAASGRLRIDLNDLLSADAVGLDALRRLRDDGAQLVRVAHYLRRWLT
jgi:anti-anti-sigma regulatory factor